MIIKKIYNIFFSFSSTSFFFINIFHISNSNSGISYYDSSLGDYSLYYGITTGSNLDFRIGLYYGEFIYSYSRFKYVSSNFNFAGLFLGVSLYSSYYYKIEFRYYSRC
jgi:hypothetical protein